MNEVFVAIALLCAAPPNGSTYPHVLDQLSKEKWNCQRKLAQCLSDKAKQNTILSNYELMRQCIQEYQ